MTIDKIYNFVNYVANKIQSGQITPDNFNLLAPQAQIELLMKKYGNPKTYTNGRPIPTVGYSMTQKTKDDVKPFIMRPAAPLAINSNEADYPEDYLHMITLEKDTGLQVKIVDVDEIGPIRVSTIIPPSESHPYAALYSDKIRVYPATVSNILIVYFRNPVSPNWDYNITEGVPVYNATATPGETGAVSKNFEFPQQCHLELCMLILQHVGVNLSSKELLQYSQVKENQGI